MSNEETTQQVRRAQGGDREAFDWIVRRFQNQAVAYAASILGSFLLGQDAAQEAFLEAYCCLPSLRAPEAFPVWFRKIVFKQCDRQRRNKQVETVSLADAEHLPSPTPALEETAERHWQQQEISRAIQTLPQSQREVVTLFYMGEQSHQDIADFLDVPVTTVKSRLHQGRSQLKERMVAMVNGTLSEARLSQGEEFTSRVNEHIARALASITPDTGRETLYFAHPVYELQNSLLVWAIEANAAEIRLSLKSGHWVAQLHRGEWPTPSISLPKPLQEALVLRIKVSADMDISQSDVLQEGIIPILYKGTGYDAFVSSRPKKQGEHLTIRLTPNPQHSADASK